MGFLIDMINVSYGDSFLLSIDRTDGNDIFILIDGGKVSKSENVIDHLKKCTDGYLDFIIATHIDNDHIGGLLDVAKNIDCGCVYINIPGNLKSWLKLKETYELWGKKAKSKQVLIESLETTNNLVNYLQKRGILIDGAIQGEYWDFNDVKLKILNPTPERLEAAWAESVLKSSEAAIVVESLMLDMKESSAPDTTNINNAGIVIELEYKGEPCGLFTADVGVDVLREVTEKRNYVWLKIPHHGSKTGLDAQFVKQFRNCTAYLPIVKGYRICNGIDLLRGVNAKTFCTEKTKYCRSNCSYSGFGTICYKKDKDGHPGWSNVDPNKCTNNI